MNSQRVEGADIGVNSELLIFSPPVTNAGIDSINWIDYRPVNQLSEHSSIEFTVPGSGASYIDLRRSRLYVKAKIVKGDGSAINSAEDSVGPVNLWLHSLFSQVDVYFQQKLISSSGTTYPYKAMIDTSLNYGSDSRESQLQAALYYKDSASGDQYMDAVTFKAMDAVMNTGLKKRAEFTEDSREVDMEGVLTSDVFNLDRYLINGVEVRIKLFQSKDPFRLMAKDGDKERYKVVLTDCVFKVCKLNLDPGLLTAHGDTIKTTPAIYPYTKTDLRSFSIAKGTYSIRIDDIFNGTVASKLVCSMVKASAFSGSYDRNPFNFQHCNIEFIAFYANGQSIPARGLQPNFEKKNFIEAYQSVFNGTGLDTKDFGCYSTREEYDQGNTLMAFCPDGYILTAGDQASLRRGNLSLEIRMSKALEEPMTLLVYGSFPSAFQVDASRAVIQ